MEQTSLYNNPVQINNLSWYLNGSIEEEAKYQQEIHALRSLEEQDRMDIYLNTPGGFFSTTASILSAMQEAKGEVCVHIVGECHSAGSIIAMHAPIVQVHPWCSMMIHTAVTGSHGTARNSFLQADFDNKFLHKVLRDTYVDFLTPLEIEEVIQGKEIWLCADEISERFNFRYEKMQAKELAEAEVDAEVAEGQVCQSSTREVIPSKI